jgi:hypothetical protein
MQIEEKMSNIQIFFVAKNAENDEKVVIDKCDDHFLVTFTGPVASGKNTSKVFRLLTDNEVRDYVTNILCLALYDDDPCTGIQFFFPGTPTVFYKHSTLKTNDVWDTMLYNLEFWLQQPQWPRQPPISPIVRPKDADTLTELIDLTEPDIKVEYSPRTAQRNVTVYPNTHTFFDTNGCPCSRFDPNRCC